MVSTIFVVISLLAFAGQSTKSVAELPANNLRADTRPDSRKDGLAQPKAPAKENAISPELRGDIYMARKMFREAADAYQSGPENAVLVNKTGIAYHQMLELDAAKKYYERSLKLNHEYPEAMNNLGTIYYAKKSYRRAISQYREGASDYPQLRFHLEQSRHRGIRS